MQIFYCFSTKKFETNQREIRRAKLYFYRERLAVNAYLWIAVKMRLNKPFNRVNHYFVNCIFNLSTYP